MLNVQNLVVLAIVTVSVMAPVMIVFVTLWHRRQVTEMRLKAMLDLAERGKDVPFEMLAAPAKIIPAASPYSAISRRH